MWSGSSEPVVKDTSKCIDALNADLRERGVWQPQTMALFDVHVINTGAKSNLSQSP